MHPDHKKNLPLDRYPHPEQVLMAGGKAASSKGPALHLIPTVALEKIADRFELGIARKGDKAWNALSKNQEILTDKELLIERTSHIIHHALKLRDQLVRGALPGEESMTDNATAVGWGAIFMTCAAEALAAEGSEKSPFEKPNMSARSGMGIPKKESALRLHAGQQYVCVNGRYTGLLIKMVYDKRYHYAGTIPDVTWNHDGEPVALNNDLTDAELRGYVILHELFG